ncbi:MAG: hypothetical protein J7L23_02735 [Candidatus Diapherotrites archaeon]|nr:hypothetical protein [Candidatus Diapherotrites archaeon]
MQAPICTTCARSGVLCPECRKKLENNEITKLDIELAGLLCKMEDKELIKGEASFERTIAVDSLLLVLTKGDIPTLIGRGGRVVRYLSQNLRKTVRVIKDTDFKTQVMDLIAPARLLGINIVYKPDGDETLIIIPKEDESKLVADLGTIEKAACLLLGNDNLKIKLK